MKKMYWIIFIVLALFLILVVIGSMNNPKTPINTGNMTYTSTSNPLSKGERLLGLDVNAQGSSYAGAFAEAKKAGIQVTQLSLMWNAIETSKSSYDDTWLSVANSFYPQQGTKIALVIGVIDTNNDVRPSDLKSKSFNDAEVIQRFENLIDHIISKTPDVEFASISVGNEIDVYLAEDINKWQEYTDFYSQVADYIRSKKAIAVGSKATLYGLEGANSDKLENLNKNSDVILATYYPLNSDFSVKDVSVVPSDLQKLTSRYSKPIQILEAGYPSSTSLGSSEQKQSEFIKQMFISWDKNPQIKLVHFIWMYDKSDAEVNSLSIYYGVSSNNFKQYLGSLGLKDDNGNNKLAWTALETEAKARGW